MVLVRIAAGVVILGLLGSPVRSEPVCSDLQKYLVGGQEAFARNRGERRPDEHRWAARSSIFNGDCEIAATFNPAEFRINCSFNAGAADPVRLVSYQSLGNDVQTCLNGMESRDDWRKRDTSRTEFDGRAIAETTWTWTMIRNGIERQIVLSNDSGESGEPKTAKNLLVVAWRERPKDD